MSDQSGKEVETELKKQMIDAINEMGKAQDALDKQKKKSKDLAVTINELTAKLIPLDEKLKDYESRFLLQDNELNELQQRIDEQKIHIEKQETTIRDQADTLMETADKMSELTQKLADKEVEEITLDEAEEILKDE